MKQNVLVSACLLGMHCRYNGAGVMCEELERIRDTYNLIPVCPEIYGGMQTPRDPAERKGEKVVTSMGEDVTDYYTRGAEEILQLNKLYQCEIAILKERSPSCGFGHIYDGSFTGKIIDGNGVTADMLAENGVRIIGESKIHELL